MRLYLFELAAPNEADIHTPGESLALVQGIYRASLRAIDIARDDQRPVFVWPFDSAARLLREGRKVGRDERRWSRYYGPGAPLVTPANYGTILDMAGLEETVWRSQQADSIAAHLALLSGAAGRAELGDVGVLIDGVAARLAPIQTIRQQDAAAAAARYDRRRGPHEAREEPVTVRQISGEAA